jgi:A/G-specific adenine glycosylase
MTDKVRGTRIDTPARRRIRARLLHWYDLNRRDLPWRGECDPYRVWLSEVMLQQTRVAAATAYYRRFLRRFPTVQALARARTSSVLAAWSGLGYYRRARALHEAAKEIVRRGEFPISAVDLQQLPGIGRYTAAAIASIAFGEAVAVVDGNVERVLRRLTGQELTRAEQWDLAASLVSRARPGDFNQAMMEWGATICLPRWPKCKECPLIEMCASRGESAQKRAETRRKRTIQYAFDTHDGAVFLVQRPGKSPLMPGMWELPEVDGKDAASRVSPGQRDPGLILHHSITVTDYTVRVLRGPAPEGVAGRWVPAARLSRLPLTGLTRKILQAAQVI